LKKAFLLFLLGAIAWLPIVTEAHEVCNPGEVQVKHLSSYRNDHGHWHQYADDCTLEVSHAKFLNENNPKPCQGKRDFSHFESTITLEASYGGGTRESRVVGNCDDWVNLRHYHRVLTFTHVEVDGKNELRITRRAHEHTHKIEKAHNQPKSHHGQAFVGDAWDDHRDELNAGLGGAAGAPPKPKPKPKTLTTTWAALKRS
jgi:hypothetical protein